MKTYMIKLEAAVVVSADPQAICRSNTLTVLKVGAESFRIMGQPRIWDLSEGISR